MPLFHYKAIDEKGQSTEGVFEAKDRFDLYHSVKKDGLTTISTKEIKKQGSFSLDALLSFLNGVKISQKIIFARNLSKMIEAGLPMTRALSVMERQSRGQFKKVLQSLN